MEQTDKEFYVAKVGNCNCCDSNNNMIIPVRCFTCGKVLGDKWVYYNKKVEELKEKGEIKDDDAKHDIVNITKKEPRGLLMDEMGVTRMCCRRHLLTHVDLIDVI